MTFSILKDYEQTSSYVEQICKLADSNKKAFGFIASSAYEQMALKNQLWVAVNSHGKLCGYLMFGGKMPILKVFQILVCPNAKNTGLGTLLIEELKCFGERKHYHTISARVASDLPANAFWDRCGFNISSQEKGGETTGRIINIRAFHLKINDLFSKSPEDQECLLSISSPMLSSPIYALDLNPIFDIAHDREHAEKVKEIIKMGLSGEIKLCITPEFQRELSRHSKRERPDPIMTFASSIPVLRSNENIDKITTDLKELVFPKRSPKRSSAANDHSDLTHLAYCIANRINGFITREKALLRANNQVFKKFRVSILSPDEMLTETSPPHEKNIKSSDISLEENESFNSIKEFLTKFNLGSEILAQLFPPHIETTSKKYIVAKNRGQIIAFYCFFPPTIAAKHADAYLYVDESHMSALAVIDHFVESSLRYGRSYLFRLDFNVEASQTQTIETLVKKGFFNKKNVYTKIICNDFIDKKKWPQFTLEFKELCGLALPDEMPSYEGLLNTGVFVLDAQNTTQQISWFDFETLVSPRFLITAKRDCILIPIQEHYAEGLIGNIRNQLTLLPNPDPSLLLEKAYFRSVTKSNYFKKGGIVAFYVSGIKSVQEIIGFARITFSDVMETQEAFIRFERQGVLPLDSLNEIADKNGKVHVFTFDNFFEFKNRISFKKAKDLGLISKANLVSAEKINSAQLQVLIMEAFKGE